MDSDDDDDILEQLLDPSGILHRPPESNSDETLTLSEICPPIEEEPVNASPSSASVLSSHPSTVLSSRFFNFGSFQRSASQSPKSPALSSPMSSEVEQPKRTFSFRERRLEVEATYLNDRAFRAYFRVTKKVFEKLLEDFGQYFPQGRLLTRYLKSIKKHSYKFLQYVLQKFIKVGIKKVHTMQNCTMLF